jgi:hypothetical protein
MVIQPAIEGMLNYAPDAMKNWIKLAPYFPWHWKFATVKNIRMNKTNVTLDLKRSPGNTSYLLSTNHIVDITFQPAFPLNTNIEKVMINGREVPAKTTEYPDGIRLMLNLKLVKGDTRIQVQTTGGIGALPVIARPEPGDSSMGAKIISEKINGKTYSLIAEGRPSREYEIEVFSAMRPKSLLNATWVSKPNAEILKLKFKLPPSADKYARQEIAIELE